MRLDQTVLLGSEQRPRLGVHPAPAGLREQLASAQAQPHRVELAVDPPSHARALPDQPGPVPHERRELTLLDRLRVHLGDQADEPHAGQKIGVDRVRLVVRLRDRPELLRVRQHHVHIRALEPVVDPRPRAARLDHHLERGVFPEQGDEPIRVVVRDTLGSRDPLAFVAHDRHDHVR